MANDKVFLRCKACGNLQFLAKYYPSGEFVEEGEWNSPAVRDFLNRHREMCFTIGSDLGGEFGFEFVCESSAGFLYGEYGPIVAEPATPTVEQDQS